MMNPIQPSLPKTTFAGAWPGAPAAPPAAARGAGDREAAISSTRSALSAIDRAAAAGGDPTLREAAAKLGRSLELLAADNVEAAMAQLLTRQDELSRNQAERATTTLSANLSRLRQQGKERVAQIKKRMDAQRAAARWGFLGKLFKFIAAAVSAVSSVVTGPVGIAAATTLAASLIVSMTVKGDLGQYLGLGLTVAAGLMTLGAGSAASAGSDAASYVGQAAKYVARAASLAAAVSALPEGICSGAALDAQAMLVEIRARMRFLRADDDEQLDELRDALGLSRRTAEQAAGVLQAHGAATAAGLAGMR